MMNILLSNENRGRGGAEQHTLQLARGLAGRGHQVSLAVRPGSWLEEVGAGQAFSMASELDLLSVLKLGHWIRSQGVEVVHCQATRDLVLCALALPAGVRLLKSEHTFLGSSRSRLLNWAYRRCCSVVAVSQALARQIEEELPGLPLEVVPNGIDLEHYGERPAPLERLCEGRWIGCLAHLIPGKGQADLITAFASLVGPDLRLLLAGEGSERVALEALAERLGVSDRVWFSGHLEDPRQALAGLAVAVVPSHSETFSLACLEALAMGVPLVATRTGGIPEVVGQAAWLVSPGDPQELAGALEGSLRQPREGGPEQAGKFSLERMLDRLEALYR